MKTVYFEQDEMLVDIAAKAIIFPCTRILVITHAAFVLKAVVFNDLLEMLASNLAITNPFFNLAERQIQFDNGSRILGHSLNTRNSELRGLRDIDYIYVWSDKVKPESIIKDMSLVDKANYIGLLSE